MTATTASLVAEESAKPVDASDVSDFDSAKAEVVRLRTLLKESVEASAAAAAAASVSDACYSPACHQLHDVLVFAFCCVWLAH